LTYFLVIYVQAIIIELDFELFIILKKVLEIGHSEVCQF